MITVATTVPVVFNLSEIRGQPPIDTSPLPSATGSLQAEIDVMVPVVEEAVATVVVVGVNAASVFVVVVTQSNLLPVFLQT